MKVLVTGGAGFIGSHLVDGLLNSGFEVIVLDNFSTGRRENLSHLDGKIDLIECDISVADNWFDYFKGVDYVFHLAALADIVPSIQKPAEYFHTNVVGTYNVLEASKRYGIKRLVYSASSSCYGIPDIYPTPETAEIKPQYPYALTKRLGEELVMHWSSVYGLNANSLRFFNVYGPRSRTSGTYGAVFGVFLAQKLAKKPFTVVGDGSQTRDFTYVTDIVEALMAVTQSEVVGKIYNVGSGRTISINYLIELLEGGVTYIPKRPGEPNCTYADTSLINRDLNWVAKIAIEEGVLKVLENINYWTDAPVWEPETIVEATRDWFLYLGKSKN
jgi:UDP-glucose 4-epimerase